MPVYLKYDSIYTDSAAFNANDITVNDAARLVYTKHVDNGNIISWSKEDFPETLTKTITIGYVDSDAYDAHINEAKNNVGDASAAWVTNTNYRISNSI